MTRISTLFVSLMLSAPLQAGWQALGGVQAERFDNIQKTWVALPLKLAYQEAPEGIQLRLPKLKTGLPLTVRLDFKRLPHFAEWVAQRQAQGGASWTALNALLGELGDGPAMALVQEPLPREGRLEIKLGLRRGTHFDPWATVFGSWEPCGPGTCFQPEEPVFTRHSAALAWKLLKPLARTQAKATVSR